jgi:hypothetical protein
LTCLSLPLKEGQTTVDVLGGSNFEVLIALEKVQSLVSAVLFNQSKFSTPHLIWNEKNPFVESRIVRGQERERSRGGRGQQIIWEGFDCA